MNESSIRISAEVREQVRRNAKENARRARLVSALRESFTDTELRDLTAVLESAEYTLDAVTGTDQSWPLRMVAAINAARIAA